MLQNRPDEGLTEAERKEAWEHWELEKKGILNGPPVNIEQMQRMYYVIKLCICFIRNDQSSLTHSSLKKNVLRKRRQCLSAILNNVYTLYMLQRLRHNEKFYIKILALMLADFFIGF